SDAGAVRARLRAGRKGAGVKRQRDLTGGLDDGAIVDALSEAARRTAIEDAGPGPTPAAWHRLQTRRARGTVPPWRGLLVAGAGVAAVVALVLVVRGVRPNGSDRPVT